MIHNQPDSQSEPRVTRLDGRTIFGRLQEFYPDVVNAFRIGCRTCGDESSQEIAQRIEPIAPPEENHRGLHVTLWLRCGACGAFALLWDGIL